MALWGPASTATTTRPRIGPRGTIAKLTPGWQDAFHRLRELPIIARYAGHLAVALLLGATLLNVLPAGADEPAATALAMGGFTSAPHVSSVRARSSEGVLEAAVLPSTSRALRGVILPLSAPQRGVRTGLTTYEVQPHDTVLGIAQRFGLSGNSILWANDSLANNADLLSIGQELTILPSTAPSTGGRGRVGSSIADRRGGAGGVTGFAGTSGGPFGLEAGRRLSSPAAQAVRGPNGLYARPPAPWAGRRRRAAGVADERQIMGYWAGTWPSHAFRARRSTRQTMFVSHVRSGRTAPWPRSPPARRTLSPHDALHVQSGQSVSRPVDLRLRPPTQHRRTCTLR